MLQIIIKGVVILINTIATIGYSKDFLAWLKSDDDKKKFIALAAQETGESEDEIKQTRAAIMYDRIEREDKNPDDFWNNLPKEAQDEIKWSPNAIRRSMERTSFLGIANALLWIGASFVGGIAVFRGITIATKYLAQVSSALKAGKDTQFIANILAEARMAALPKVGIPGFIAGMLGMAGWQVGTWANNLNDVDFWGREQIRQAEEDFRKMAEKEKAGGAVVGGGFYRQPVTRISTQKTAKPKTYIGTLLGGRIAEAKPFVRQLDDEITDEKDLLKDAQINMVNWLASLPGKITYEVQVKFNPFDENQIRKVGYWVTLALYVNNNLNKRLFVDEILLGPIDPIRYYPESTISKTVQMELPKELTPTEIKALQTDMGELITIDETGNMVRTFPEEQKAQGTSERQNIAVLEKMVADLKQKISTKVDSATPTPAEAIPKQGIISAPPILPPVIPQQTILPLTLPGTVQTTTLSAIIPSNFPQLTPEQAKMLGIGQPPAPPPPTFTLPTTSAPVSVPPPPPPPPPAPPAFPADPWEVGKTVFVNTPGTILNIRDGAALSARDIGDLPHKMAVTILSQPTYKDGYSWIIVRTSAGQTGYVAKEYLVLS